MTGWPFSALADPGMAPRPLSLTPAFMKSRGWSWLREAVSASDMGVSYPGMEL